MGRVQDFRPIKVSNKSRWLDAIGATNRLLQLLGDRTLSEVLMGITILELWVSLIVFVFWLTLGGSSPELRWTCAGILMLLMLGCLVTGGAAMYTWLIERGGRPKVETSRWEEW